MTLDEAVDALEQTLPSKQLRVDRKLARHDSSDYLLIVLDARRGLADGDGPVENGPRLVSKRDGAVTRVTVPEAIARARSMRLVAPDDGADRRSVESTVPSDREAGTTATARL